MMTSVKGLARKSLAADKKARAARQKQTVDSLQNFAAGLGIGTDNLSSAATYGFNPITRIRTLLEWIHRGSWLGGVIVDVIADDMAREGVELKGDIDPSDIDKIQEMATALNIWGEFSDGVRWSRLYGGSVCVLMIDGQDYSTPFRIETVAKGQFRGLYTIDRWGIDPSLENLVTEQGPHLGLPKFYYVTAEAPALRGKKIHYTRLLRFEGVRLPFWQRVMENLWGISEIERVYDRMVAFDSATTGAAQLVYKSYIRTYTIEGLREIVAAGGKGLQAMLAYVNFMRQTQSTEGVTLLDGKDTFETYTFSGFGGLSDVLLQLGQQLAGATTIPLVRLFGQAPAGLNSTGESDLRTYYDGILHRQNKHKTGITTVYRCIAQSEGVKLPEGFSLAFRPLWQLTPEQKATVGQSNIDAIMKVAEKGIVSDQVILKELKQQSPITGLFSNISKEDIEGANDEPAPRSDELLNPRETGDPAENERKRKIHVVADSDKIPQALANYTDRSRKETHCGTCLHFGGEGACRIVKSSPLPIRDEGGCDFYKVRSNP